DDEHGALEQRADHGMRALLDQVRLIVDGDDVDVRSVHAERAAAPQALLQLGEPFLDALDDLSGIFTQTLDDDAGDSLALPVDADGALPIFRAQAQRGEVAHADGNAILIRY